MSLDFIKDDPVGQGFDAAWARNERVRKAKEEYGVDEAIRGGLGDVIAGQPQQAPAPQQYASLSTPPVPSAASTTSDAGAGDRWSTMNGFEGTAPNRSPGVAGAGAVGFGQVIPSTYASWQQKYGGANPWMPATHADYAAAPLATQQRVYNDIVGPNEYDPALRAGGHETSPVNYAMVNFLGPAGGTKFLQAARDNPNAIAADVAGAGAANNNRAVFYDPSGRPRTVAEVVQYVGSKGGGGATGGGAVPNVMLADATASGIAMGGSNSMPGQTGPNYNPILERLQGAPGGGRTALDLLGRQGKTDVAQGRRLDSYQRLAMQAMGRGDVPTARYYAQLGGLNLPEGIFQDGAMMKKTAVGSLLAQRIYRTDAVAGQRFLQTYLQTGNVDQAFAAAGPPRDNPHYSLAWVRDGEREYAVAFQSSGQGAGTVRPVMQPGAQPAQPDATPPQPPAIPAPPPDAQAQQPYPPLTLAPVPSATGAPPPAQPASPPPAAAPAPPPAAAPAAPSIGVPGQLSRTGPSGAGGRVADRTLRLQMLMKSGMFTEQEANAIAGGAALSTNQLAQLVQRAPNAIDPAGEMPSAQRQKAAGEYMDGLFPGWRQRLSGQPSPSAAAGALPSGGAQSYQPLTLAPRAGAAPTTPAARDTGAQPAPPNPAQRVPNTVYQTPRGPMKWTGTGWLPAQ